MYRQARTIALMVLLPTLGFSQAESPLVGKPPAGSDLQVTREEITAAQTVVKRLRGKFITEKDTFDGMVSYHHKAYSYYTNGDGTTLRASIYGDSLFISSVFVGHDWIFHTKGTIKLGNILIPFIGKADYKPGMGCYENVSLKANESEKVAYYLAVESSPALIRLEGAQIYDYKLRSKHRQAIKDTYEFWKALQKLAKAREGI